MSADRNRARSWGVTWRSRIVSLFSFLNAFSPPVRFGGTVPSSDVTPADFPPNGGSQWDFRLSFKDARPIGRVRVGGSARKLAAPNESGSGEPAAPRRQSLLRSQARCAIAVGTVIAGRPLRGSRRT